MQFSKHQFSKLVQYYPFISTTDVQIFACLNSGYVSVLVNGSHTSEFKIERGIRQGENLSPLLFILAIEALNVVINEAKTRNLFRGVEVGKDKINVLHFQFVNDALILREWSFSNFKTYLASFLVFILLIGLKLTSTKANFLT